MGARYRLRDLIEKGMGVTEQRLPQALALLDGRREKLRFHSQAKPGDLHVDAVGSPVIAEQHRKTDKSFASDGADFGGGALSHRMHERANTGREKVNVLNWMVRLIKDPFVVKLNGFEMGFKHLEVRWRQGGQQTVLWRNRNGIHEGILHPDARRCNGRATRTFIPLDQPPSSIGGGGIQAEQSASTS